MFSYLALKGLYEEDGKLFSPVRWKRWRGNTLTAKKSDVIRGFGIFATVDYHEADGYGNGVYIVAPTIKDGEIMVVAERGWRSQRATIIKQCTDEVEFLQMCIDAYYSGYPQVPVIETVIKVMNNELALDDDKRIDILKRLTKSQKTWLFENMTPDARFELFGIREVRSLSDVRFIGIDEKVDNFTEIGMAPYMNYIQDCYRGCIVYPTNIRQIHHNRCDAEYKLLKDGVTPSEFINLLVKSLDNYRQHKFAYEIAKLMRGEDYSALTIAKSFIQLSEFAIKRDRKFIKKLADEIISTGFYELEQLNLPRRERNLLASIIARKFGVSTKDLYEAKLILISTMPVTDFVIKRDWTLPRDILFRLLIRRYDVGYSELVKLMEVKYDYRNL